jgi:hypothetical protein
MRKSIPFAIAITIGATAALSHVSPSSAGPLPTAVAAVKTAVPEDVIEVRNRAGAIFAGVALGLLGAAIVGNSYYGPSYYYPAYPQPYYYSPYPYYAPYRYPYYRRYWYGYRRYW